jgi:hypothetical protein
METMVCVTEVQSIGRCIINVCSRLQPSELELLPKILLSVGIGRIAEMILFVSEKSWHAGKNIGARRGSSTSSTSSMPRKVANRLITEFTEVLKGKTSLLSVSS